MENKAIKTVETVVVRGKADDKKKAFAQALGQIQDKVLKTTSDVILRIEPQDVTVLTAEENRFTERFLFFFLPRVRTFYRVELKVVIEVSRIRTEAVIFSVKEQKDPNSVSLPFFKCGKSAKG